MATLGANFYPKLVQMSSELGLNPEDLLAFMVSESNISPGAGKGNGAAGLIQFMPDTLKGVGFKGNQDDFRKLSGEDQIPYIKEFFKNKQSLFGGPFTDAAQYYVADFYPVALKLPGIRKGDPSTPFVEENPQTVLKNGQRYSKKYFDVGVYIRPEEERKAYKANPLFHGSVPGAITYGDMINQINKNKRTATYQKALMAMKDTSGYTPNKNNETMVATKFQKNIKNKPQSNLLSMINSFLQKVMASEKSNKKLYKNFLPKQNIIIEVNSENYTDTIEFSRILCMALDEELMAKSFIYTDNSNVEVECIIYGSEQPCFNTVKQLTESVADTFKKATYKLGGININSNIIINKKPSYETITLHAAQTQYRKFLLKFI